MYEEAIKLETAKLASKKGFNIRQIQYFDSKDELVEIYSCYCDARDVNICSCGAQESYDAGGNATQAPSQALLQKWLREIHNIHITMNISNIGNYYAQVYEFIPENKNNIFFFKSQNVFEKMNSYEEAMEVGLLEALKLI